MCLLSKNAIKNPDTAEAQVEAWAWRQLDGLLHTGNYEGVATFEANGFTVVDPWVREDAQFAEAWPDHCRISPNGAAREAILAASGLAPSDF